jgi:flagellar motor protein MotB
MYSISKADAQRFKKFQEGMQQAFHLGVLQGRDAVSVEDTAGAMVGVDSSTAMGPVTLPAAVAPAPLPTTIDPIAAATPFVVTMGLTPVAGSSAASPASAQTSRPVAATAAPAPISPGAPSSAAIAQQIQSSLAGLVTSNSDGGVDVRVGSEGIVISLYGVLAFQSGETDIEPQGRAVLTRVADEIRGLPYDVRVEGHTDSIQPDGGPYPSNWDLSTARALAVTHVLIDSAHFAPGRLSAAGYAEFRPVATNATRDGRSRNRRVDLVLIYQSPTGGNP